MLDTLTKMVKVGKITNAEQQLNKCILSKWAKSKNEGFNSLQNIIVKINFDKEKLHFHKAYYRS